MDMRSLIALAENASPKIKYVFYGYKKAVEKSGEVEATKDAVIELCDDLSEFIDWNDRCNVVLTLPNGKVIEFGRHDLEQDHDSSSFASNSASYVLKALGIS